MGVDGNKYHNLVKVGNRIVKKSAAVGLIPRGRISVTPSPFNLF